MDLISKEKLYAEVDALQNVETILDILASGTSPLESEEAATAYAAKDDIVQQYIYSAEDYAGGLMEDEAEYQSSLSFKQKTALKCRGLLHYGLSFFFKNHANPDVENVDYEEIRHQHYTTSLVDCIMDRLEALSDIYESLQFIAYLDSQGQADQITSKILIEVEKNNIMPLLRGRIESGVTTLKKLVDVPFPKEPTNKPVEITFDSEDQGQERYWVLLALVNNALHLNPEKMEKTPLLQDIKFKLPEQIKSALYHIHTELGLVAGKYFYDNENMSPDEASSILTAQVFNDKREVMSETAKILYSLSNSILVNGINEKVEYSRDQLSASALKFH